MPLDGVIETSKAEAERLIAERDSLKADRAQHEATWDVVRDYLYPSGPAFQVGESRGQRDRQKIFDSTGEHAAEMAAAGLHAFLTNPAVQWFSLRAVNIEVDDDEDAARWLEDATRRMNVVFSSPQSRFQIAVNEVYLEEVLYGNACLGIFARRGKLPLFSAKSLTEVVWAENDEDEIDTQHWRFQLTAAQAAKKWGADALPQNIREAAGDPRRQHDWFDFQHSVTPNRQRVRGVMGPRGMGWRSVWIAVAERAVVQTSGYRTFCYVDPRWQKRPNELYGRGMGAKALADVLTMNRAKRSTIRGAEQAIEPPLQVADDGVLSVPNLRPKAINRVRTELMAAGRDGIRPIQTGARPDIGMEFTEALAPSVERAFLKELLQLARDPRMTATHVLELREESMRGMSPVLSRLEPEFLGKIVDRTFDIMWHGRMFAPPPPSLSGAEIRGEFMSPSVRAQRVSMARAIAERWTLMAPAINADPSILDNEDLDLSYREVGEILGAPRRLQRPVAEVQAIRRARAETQQADQAKEDAASLMAAAGKGAPALAALGQMQDGGGGQMPGGAPAGEPGEADLDDDEAQELAGVL